MFSGLAAMAGLLLLGFLTTPFLLRWLGDERLGAFRVATDWGGYLQLLELGLGGSVQALLAVALGRQRRQQVVFTLAAAVRAYALLGLVMLATGASLAAFLPYLVREEPDLWPDLRLGFCVGLSVYLLTPLA